MKNRIEDNLACIIFRLPEKRFQVWVFMIVAQAVQLMEPGAYLLSQMNPDNKLFYCLRVILGFFTFRPLAQQFHFFCIVIQALYWVYIVLLVFRLIFGTPHVCGFLAYAQIWCPVVITVSMESFKLFNSTFVQVLSGFSAVSSTALWGLRLFTINQDYLSSNAKLSSIKSTLRLVLYSIQSVLVYLPPTQALLTALAGVSLSMSLVIFLLSIVIIENVNQELEYLHYLKCIFATIFYSTLQFVMHTPQTDYMLVVLPGIALVLERLEGLKFLFEIKYDFLLQRIVKVQSDKDLIIFLEMLGNNVSTGQNTQGVRRGRNKSYWTNKKIEFGFHVKARSACFQLCIKRAKQQGGDITIGQLLKEETYTLVQSFMHKRIRSKSKLVPIVLSYQFLKRELVITALSIQASMEGDLDFNTRVLKKVLKMRIQHVTSIKQKMGSSYKVSQGFCCTGTQLATSKISEVSKAQDLFQQIVQKLTRLSSNKTKILSKLTSRTVSTSDVVGVLLQHTTLKNKLQEIVNNLDSIVNKQIITSLYIYYKYFCSQKFSVFQTLAKHMVVLDDTTFNPNSEYMVCLVSAAQKNMGAILTANSKLVEFFKMDLEQIRQGVEHIEDILPRPLSVIHNSLIARSLQTGESNMMGKKNQFYVIRRGVVSPVQFSVKFQVFEEGINFSCQFRVTEDKNLILYDKENYILGMSETAKQILPKKKQQSRFVHEVFPSLRRLNPGTIKDASSPSTYQRVSQYQIKFTVRNKYYETPNFQLGICQFVRNAEQYTIDSKQHVSKALLDEVQNSLATEVVETEDFQYLKLETKITSRFKNTKTIWNFNPVVFTYGVILLAITIGFYVDLIGVITQSQTAIRFTNMLYDNSLQSLYLSTNRITNMRYAANSGMFPSDFNIKGTNIRTYLAAQGRELLDGLYRYKAKVIRDVSTLPQELVELMNTQKLAYITRSGSKFVVDFVTFVSTYHEEQQQIMFYSEQDFQSMWSVIANKQSSVANIILPNLDSSIEEPMQQQIIQFKTQSVFFSKIFLLVIEGVVLLGIGIFSVVIHRASKQQTRSIQLLLLLEDRFFKQQMHQNYQLNIMLNQIAKSSMSGLVINQNAQSVTFTCLGDRRKFSRDDSETIGERIHTNNPMTAGGSTNTNSRKVLDNKSQKIKKYIYMAITVLIFFPVACLMVIGSIGVSSPVYKAEQFYQAFAKSNANLSISTSSLLNLNILKITNSPQINLMGVPVADYLKSCVSSINNRSTDSILTSFVPSVSNNMLLKTQIQNYLYTSKCLDPNDNDCQHILGGSLTRGIPSAIMAFSTAASSLYYSMDPTTPSSEDFSTLKQLVEVYNFYLRGLIQQTQFAFGLANTVYQSSLLQLDVILKVSVVAQLLLLVFIAGFVVNSQTRTQRLKKEIYTILPVDILSNNISFNYQIRSLIET